MRRDARLPWVHVTCLVTHSVTKSYRFCGHLVACGKITFAFVKSLFERDDYELRPGGLCVKEPVCCVYKRSSAAPILSRMYIGAGGLSYSGAVISDSAISDPFFFF